jgi:hypothetical protein
MSPFPYGEETSVCGFIFDYGQAELGKVNNKKTG